LTSNATSVQAQQQVAQLKEKLELAWETASRAEDAIIKLQRDRTQDIEA
jgi:hypothetical protein